MLTVTYGARMPAEVSADVLDPASSTITLPSASLADPLAPDRGIGALLDWTIQEPSPSPDAATRVLTWARVRLALLIGYVVSLVVFVSNVGLPTERLALYSWVLGGLSICCVGQGWRAAAVLIRDWLPFVGILVLYDLTRGLADTLGMPLHLADLAALESWLFGGTLPTVWLQDQLLAADGWGTGGEGSWWLVLVTAIYVSHFLVTPIIAAVLWVRDRTRWISYVAHVVGVALLGVAIYVLLPAAPPWYAAREGVIPPVERLSNLGWDILGLDRAGALLDQGQAKVNLVAALPSLHTAYAVLLLAFFWPRVTKLTRALLATYPLAMGFVLVYAGEHYVVDVVLGWVVVGVVAIAVSRMTRIRNQQRAVARGTTGD